MKVCKTKEDVEQYWCPLSFNNPNGPIACTLMCMWMGEYTNTIGETIYWCTKSDPD